MAISKSKRTVERAVKCLDDVLPIAKREVNTNAYFHGMYNGMQMARNCMTGEEPNFIGKDEIGRYRNEKFRRGNPK